MLFREEDEDLEVLPFADRAEAGRILASKLSAYQNALAGRKRSAQPAFTAQGGRQAKPEHWFMKPAETTQRPWDGGTYRMSIPQPDGTTKEP